MIKRYAKASIFFGLAAGIFIFTGCGGGGSSSSSSGNTAIFVDRITQGLQYDCGGIAGKTDENGSFKFVSGKPCTFSVGNLSFSASADAVSKGYVTPYDVTANKDEAVALAQVLQSVSDFDTNVSMVIDANKAKAIPADFNLGSDALTRESKLIDAGIRTRPLSMAKYELDKFVKSDGTLVYSKRELLDMLASAYVRKFPTVARVSGLSNAALTRYIESAGASSSASGSTGSQNITYSSGTTSCAPVSFIEMNETTMSKASIGAAVSTSCSAIAPTSIFNLGLMNSSNLIEDNPQASSASSTYSMQSNAVASEGTSQTVAQKQGAFQIFGFQASASYAKSIADQNSQNIGSASIVITQQNYGETVQILGLQGILGQFLSTGNGGQGPLTQQTIDTQFVIPAYSQANGKSYISSFTTNPVGYGYGEYYQNIQILNAMETLFESLGAQYAQYNNGSDSTDANIAKLTVNLMYVLREQINAAILDFYASAGDSFVSQVTLASSVQAQGTLNTSSISDTNSTATSYAVSAQYSNASWAAKYQQSNVDITGSGMAKVLQNTTVSAVSYPYGYVSNPSSWAASINTNLQAAQTSVTIPSITMPPVTASLSSLPTVNTQSAQPAMTPPSNLFQNLGQWGTYQSCLQQKGQTPTSCAQQASANGGGSSSSNNSPETNAGTKAETSIIQDGGGQWVMDGLGDNESNASAVRLDSDTIKHFKQEMRDIADLKRSRLNAHKTTFQKVIDYFSDMLSITASSASNQIPQSAPVTNVTYNNSFVADLQTTPYAQVIPQLMPNLFIPGDSNQTQLTPFQVAATVMTYIGYYNNLGQYLNFLSNESLSNIANTNISSSYQNALASLTQDLTSHVQMQLALGLDANESYCSSLITNFTCTSADCYLMNELGDYDALSYITNLMKADNQKIWLSAPGGYAPIIFNDFNQTNPNSMRVFIPTGLTYNNFYANITGATAVLQPLDYSITALSDPNQDVLSIYQNASTQAGINATPLFPIFQYNQASPTNLIFVEYISGNKVIFTNNYIFVSTQPDFNMMPTYTNGILNAQPNIQFFSYVNPPSGSGYDTYQINQFISKDSSYGYIAGNLNWNYSLSFPNSTPSQSIINKYNVLALYTTPSYSSSSSYLNFIDSSGLSQLQYYTPLAGSESAYNVFYSQNSGQFSTSPAMQVYNNTTSAKTNLCTSTSVIDATGSAISGSSTQMSNLAVAAYPFTTFNSAYSMDNYYNICYSTDYQNNTTMPPFLLLPINATTSQTYANTQSFGYYATNSLSTTGNVLPGWFQGGYNMATSLLFTK